MAIYSKYEAGADQDGSRMGVHDALVLINRAITQYLSPDSGVFDADTQFCSAWFINAHGEWVLLVKLIPSRRPKGTTVDGVEIAGVVESGSGKVRLLKRAGARPNRTPPPTSACLFGKPAIN